MSKRNISIVGIALVAALAIVIPAPSSAHRSRRSRLYAGAAHYRGRREARRCYAAATSALVPRWRAYMSSTHLNPGRSFSESRNRRDWAVRSSG